MNTRLSGLGSWAALGLVLSLVGGDVAAQTADSTVVQAAGPEYDAGGLYRFLFGSGYRELWTRPITVPVLDLATFAGGVIPFARTGGQQTKALRLRSTDGHEFFFRSLDKDPSSVLPPDLKGTVAASVVQDQTKSSLPTAPLVVSRLLKAAGIHHAEPVIVRLPDDPALGEFRQVFAGLMGTVEAAVGGRGPNAHWDDAVEIIGSDSLMALLNAGSDDRVDATAFLKARLFDIMIGDWDRHRDQWRWARFDEKVPRLWKPVPLDRDQAFAKYDGFLLGLGRQVAPQLTNYGPNYPGMVGATWNGRDLDRRFLVGLERTDWDSVARDLRFSLADTIIRDAVRALPPQHYNLIGVTLIDWLRLRRDQLSEAARDFYSLLAAQVDLHGTSGSDRASIARNDLGDVTVKLTAEGDSAPYLTRNFRSSDTKELRVYLGDGADTAVVSGAGSKIRVRVIGEGGTDQLVDSAAHGDEHFYDDPSGATKTGGNGTGVNRKPYTAPRSDNPKAPPQRDWGNRWQANIWASGGPDVGVFLGGGQTYTTYGFRKVPWSSQHTIRVGFATGPKAFRGEYKGAWQMENSRTRLELLLRGSGIEVISFHGFGNEFDAPEDDEFYRVTQQQYTVAPALSFGLSEKVRFTIGPELKFVHTDNRRNRFLATLDPYGDGSFGEFGGTANLVIDGRNRKTAATHGGMIAIGGTFRPAAWDVKETFGDVHGEATVFLSPKMPMDPTLSFRVGGKKVFGDAFPFFESAFIGDRSTVRLGTDNRYAGDASAYGSSELRLYFFRTNIVVPTDVGVFGLADVGRVYLDGENSDKWHSAFGGGIWFGFLSRASTLSVAAASSDERTRVYVQAGFGF